MRILSIPIQKQNATISKRQVQCLRLNKEAQLSKSRCPAYLVPTYQNVLNPLTDGKKIYFSEGLQPCSHQQIVASRTHKYQSVLSVILFYFCEEFIP